MATLVHTVKRGFLFLCKRSDGPTARVWLFGGAGMCFGGGERANWWRLWMRGSKGPHPRQISSGFVHPWLVERVTGKEETLVRALT